MNAREPLDLSEKGAARGGARQSLDRRLFMQLLAFGECAGTEGLAAALEAAGIEGVLYADVNDRRGVGLLTLSEDPAFFVTTLRDLLNREPFASLASRPDYTMLGRTYALGYEPDLEEALLDRPRRTVLNRRWPWHVWYPLRRRGEFARLPEEEQRRILTEHGRVGAAFGQADLAHDIRLACFGLDRNDNDFVVGLVGRDLHALSYLVQRMRSTEQTSRYIERLGPFFVGRAVWQGPGR